MIDRVGEDAPSVFLIGNPIVFQFEATGVETATTIRRMAYQLLSENGEPLSSIESIQPHENELITLDFQRDLRNSLYTKPFDGQCISVRQHPEAITKFKIKYWEIVWDKQTCVSVIENETTTELFTVLNSAPQFWIEDNQVSGDYLMTYLPKTIPYCKGSCFQFSAMFATNHLKLDIYGDDPDVPWETFSYYVPVGVPLTVSIIPHVLANYIFNLPQPGYLTLQETQDHITAVGIRFGEVEIARIQYSQHECCYDAELKYQSSWGGFGKFFMQIYTIDTKMLQSSTVCSPYTTEKTYDTLLQNGLQTSDKKVVTNIVLKRPLDDDRLDYTRLLEDIHNANKHWLRLKLFKDVNNNDSDSLVQFNLTSAKVQQFNSETYNELVLTGTLSTPLNRPV